MTPLPQLSSTDRFVDPKYDHLDIGTYSSTSGRGNPSASRCPRNRSKGKLIFRTRVEAFGELDAFVVSCSCAHLSVAQGFGMGRSRSSERYAFFVEGTEGCFGSFGEGERG